MLLLQFFIGAIAVVMVIASVFLAIVLIVMVLIVMVLIVMVLIMTYVFSNLFLTFG